MKVSREDLGKPESPGEYVCHGVRIRVDYKQLEIWREHPEAVFNVVSFQPLAGPRAYILGSWEADD